MIGFYVSFAFLFLSIFTLLHLSEIGFLASAVEQASFAAARSEFVGLRGKRSAEWIMTAAIDPVRKRTFGDLHVKTERRDASRVSRVEAKYRGLLPFLSKSISLPRGQSFRCREGNRGAICGYTAVPPRSQE